ncbi:MAG: DUF952 domain-containing protein [Pseudomonadota bacterium]
MHIYKLLRPVEYEELQRLGQTAGAPVDVADGFVHFSTADQLAGTLAKHFAGHASLWLLTIDGAAPDVSASLEWEPSRGGALFPHLYAPLRLADVIEARLIEAAPDGAHTLPDGLR